MSCNVLNLLDVARNRNAVIDGKLKYLSRLERMPLSRLVVENIKKHREEVNTDIDKLIDENKAIMKIVDESPVLDANEKRVLYLYYLCGKTMSDIAVEMSYCVRQIERFKKSAREKLNT